MALKTVLETLDGVDDALKEFYTETDGKFVLQLADVNNHPDVVNLKTAYERVKADKAKAADERDAFKAKLESVPDDFDAEKWAKLKDGKADEAALIALRKELEAERDEYKAKAEETEAKLFQTAIERDLTDELSRAGITVPKYIQAARRDISEKVKINETGKPIVESDMGPIDLGEYVKKYAAGEGKDFVTQAKGSGKNGNDGGAPAAKKWDEMTSSEKKVLFETNPEEYNRVKAASA